MTFFNSLLSSLGLQSPPGPRPAAPEPVGHRRVLPFPPEIIGSIASFLQPESAASFSISCRSVYSILGTQHLKALVDKASDSDRYNFLTLLERQLPNHILCYYCKKFHSVDKANRHLKSCYQYSSEGYLPCWISHHKLQTEYFIHSGFSFTVFQMTMKQHRLGRDCSELLNLLSVKPTTSLQYGYVARRTVSAKIIAGSMVLRERRVFMLPPERLIPWDLLVLICPHFRLLSTSSFDENGSIVLPLLADWPIPKDRQSGNVQCKHCLTEFKVTHQSFEQRGTAMFVTRWLDLGKGESALDYQWQSHVSAGAVRGQDTMELPLVSFHRGSIGAAFEQKDDLTSDFETVLSSEDEKELFRESLYSWPKTL